jgi:hypothetical protein
MPAGQRRWHAVDLAAPEHFIVAGTVASRQVLDQINVDHEGAIGMTERARAIVI